MRATPSQPGTLILMLLAAIGCADEDSADPRRSPADRSPTAQMEIVEALRQDRQAVRHAADGGGSVRLLEGPEPVAVSQPGRWRFVYQAGPLGIVEGGWLFFQAPPFWGWSTPQTVVPEGLGYTAVSTDAEGLSLVPTTVDQQLMAIQIAGRALVGGEEITIDYGAGPAGALADRYAERRSCFFFAVDGDGDGIRSLVDATPCVEIGPGPAAALLLGLPSTGRPQETARLTVAVLDAGGNVVSDWQGRVELQLVAGDARLPASIELAMADRGAGRVEIGLREPGILRVAARTESGLVGVSNPLQVEADAERILWADLHGHSALSDGTGTPRDYLRYARDVTGLDVVALTDHDHWGMRPLANHPEIWEEIRRETELLHRPGEFVTLLGYEWTNWIHGHRHVLYFADQGEIFDSLDPRYESPLQLWEALRGQPALTFAHHSAGGPVATNWQMPPDPELEPVTEIVSVHGSSEAMDSPAVIYSPVAGNFVRDVLDSGQILGFVGSGDGHDGHPGLAHWNAVSGGLAAILSPELTREGVLEALRSRRVYATNGPRILLDIDLAGRSMGAVMTVAEWRALAPTERRLEVRVVANTMVDRLEAIRSGRVSPLDCEGTSCATELTLESVEAGDYVYLRVVQQDGGAAWSSPIFFR